MKGARLEENEKELEEVWAAGTINRSLVSIELHPD
jgi:hypothetical protein